MANKKKRPGWAEVSWAPDPDDHLTPEQVGYLFGVRANSVVGWAKQGRIIAVPGTGYGKFLAEEVRRLYVEVGGSPEGHWRTWPRTARKGLRQHR